MSIKIATFASPGTSNLCLKCELQHPRGLGATGAVNPLRFSLTSAFNIPVSGLLRLIPLPLLRLKAEEGL